MKEHLTTRGIISILREVFPYSVFKHSAFGPFTCFFLSERNPRNEPHRVEIQVTPVETGIRDKLVSATLSWSVSVVTDLIQHQDTLMATSLDDILGWASWIRTEYPATQDQKFFESNDIFSMPHTMKLLWVGYEVPQLRKVGNSQPLWLFDSSLKVTPLQPGNLSNPKVLVVSDIRDKKPTLSELQVVEQQALDLLNSTLVTAESKRVGPLDINGEPLWEANTTAFDLDAFKEVIARTQQKTPTPMSVIVAPEVHAALQKEMDIDKWLGGLDPILPGTSRNLSCGTLPVRVEPLIKANEIYVVYSDGSRQKYRI